ncbi:MAG: TlpA disulfide reductase family protein [Alphaproteobacteria bacterium]|nr:TlpA disulfide reductase family protein [Alphaproteobacteria bacterium]
MTRQTRSFRTAAAAALLALFAAACQPGGPDASGAGAVASKVASLEEFRTGEFAELDLSQDLPIPAAPFLDAAGQPHTFGEFAGKVVVLNIWAEWCAPCVEEMPTLAGLQKLFPDGDVVVLPVAFGYEDKRDSARTLLTKLVGDGLPFYYDSTYNVTYDAKTGAFPSTIIYGKDGKEAARLVKPADWSSKTARELVQAIADGVV